MRVEDFNELWMKDLNSWQKDYFPHLKKEESKEEKHGNENVQEYENDFGGSIVWIVYLGNRNTQSNFPMSGRILPQHLQVIADEANYFFQIATLGDYIQSRVYEGSYKFKSRFWQQGDTIVVLADNAKIASDFVAEHLAEPIFAEKNFYTEYDGETFINSTRNPEKSSLKTDGVGNIIVINFDSICKNVINYFTQNVFEATGFTIAHGIGHNATEGGHTLDGMLIEATSIKERLERLYKQVITPNLSNDDLYRPLKDYIKKSAYKLKSFPPYVYFPNAFLPVSGLKMLALPVFNDYDTAKSYPGSGIGKTEYQYITVIKQHYAKKSMFGLPNSSKY
jgi:hypothetical protein